MNVEILFEAIGEDGTRRRVTSCFGGRTSHAVYAPDGFATLLTGYSEDFGPTADLSAQVHGRGLVAGDPLDARRLLVGFGEWGQAWLLDALAGWLATVVL